MAATLTKRVLSVAPSWNNGGTTFFACDTYGLYTPASYDGSTNYPLIVHWHGSTEVWNGLPGDSASAPWGASGGGGNKGVQLTNAGSEGLGDGVLQMLGLPNFTNAVPGWAEGAWEALIVFPQYGNEAQQTTGTLRGNGRGKTASLIYTAIKADLLAAGFKVDTNRIYMSGVSLGSTVALTVAADEKRNATRTLAGMLVGGASPDQRYLDYVVQPTATLPLTTNFASLPATWDAFATYLADLPIVATAGQGDTSVRVDVTPGTVVGTARDLASALWKTSNNGGLFNYQYCEFDSTLAAGGSSASHTNNYTSAFFTTVWRDWLFAQRLVQPTPNHLRKQSITLTAIPVVSGDPTQMTTYEVTLADASLASLANGGVLNAAGTNIGIYTNATYTTRIKALKVSQSLAAGTAFTKFVFGMPPGSGLNVGATVVAAWGATNITWDVNADGRLAYDWRVRRAFDFGDGATVTVTNQAQTVYPDRVVFTDKTETYTKNGTPAATTSPVGGALVAKSTDKNVKTTIPAWWAAKTNTANSDDTSEATAALPYGLMVQFRPNGAVAADQCLAGHAIAGGTTNQSACALLQGAASTLKLRHGTVAFTHPTGTVNAGVYNFAGANLRTTTARDLWLNPASGVAKGTDTTSIPLTAASSTALFSAELDIGHRNIGGARAELANADIAKVLIAEFSTPNTYTVLPDDWFIAQDWAWRGVGTSYTLGAVVNTNASTGGLRTTLRSNVIQ